MEPSPSRAADRPSKLLKKLARVNAPIGTKTLLLPTSTEQKPEAPTSNLLPFERMLEGLHCFSQTRRLTDEENAALPRHWLFWRVDPKTVLSFSAPPIGSWNDAFKQELDPWANAKPAPATNIVSSLSYQAVKLGETADDKVLIPSGLTPHDKSTFEKHLAIRHRIRQDLTKRSGLNMTVSIHDPSRRSAS